MFTALGLPFLGSILLSKDTFWPSFRVSNPDCSSAEIWTKTSGPPPSTTMKPKPFCALKHLTVPVGIVPPLFRCCGLLCQASPTTIRFHCPAPDAAKVLSRARSIRRPNLIPPAPHDPPLHRSTHLVAQ